MLQVIRVLVILVHIKKRNEGVLMLQIDKTSNKPLFEQVVLGIKEEVLQGILLPGDKLLSVREMASELLINPNTISKAYKVLEDDEVIVTVRGKGTFIKELDRDVRDDKQIKKVKQQFVELIIEATYLNVTKEELHGWIDDSVAVSRRA